MYTGLEVLIGVCWISLYYEIIVSYHFPLKFNVSVLKLIYRNILFAYQRHVWDCEIVWGIGVCTHPDDVRIVLWIVSAAFPTAAGGHSLRFLCAQPIILTHCDLDKIVAIWQTSFWNASSVQNGPTNFCANFSGLSNLQSRRMHFYKSNTSIMIYDVPSNISYKPYLSTL